jgi:hypothetical protein
MQFILLALTTILSITSALPAFTARANINAALQKQIQLTDEGLKAVIAKANHPPLTRSVNIGQLNNIVDSNSPVILVGGIPIKQDNWELLNLLYPNNIDKMTLSDLQVASNPDAVVEKSFFRS